MKIFLSIFVLLFSTSIFAADNYPLDPSIDVVHYEFSIFLSDSNDQMIGEANIRIAHKGTSEHIFLDLIEVGDDGKGMRLDMIMVDNEDVKWTHSEGRIKIELNEKKIEGKSSSVYIKYKGIPRTGLIISTNRHGDRTFFGDNWPDRARNWIPCVDHPSDKATVEYKVYAPEHYSVVANGTLYEESSLPEGRKLSHWKIGVAIPTKVMVIGVARFASQLVGSVDGIDIWTYVFPEDRDNGFNDYAIAVQPMEFFSKVIGPYSYEKLANVQSKTMYGGMENAGCIFYSERSVSGENRVEGLMAHEIAHQWFGTSVTEQDWHHIWLSEGFATYFTSYYLENQYGQERMKSSMEQSRNRIIRAIERDPSPVIDTTITNFMRLLSTYSYQKGAWFLHMLRNEIGDKDFMMSVRTYYKKYKNQTALTSDFQEIAEEIGGKDLSEFFYQWLYLENIPTISYSWEYSSRKKEIIVDILQEQDGVAFTFPLDLAIISDDKESLERTIVKEKEHSFVIKSSKKPDEVKLDPRVNLLFIEK